MRFSYLVRRSMISWRDHRKLLWLGFSLTVFTLLYPHISPAYQVELAWDPSVSVVDGYRIFIREEWGTYNYDNPEWEGLDTTCAIDGLAEGIVYCFVCRAFNEFVESEDSNEVRTSRINSWVRIDGTIRYEGSPLCAMVLANGQYMFTCGQDTGFYDLEVPLDPNTGEITLQVFASGFSPFKSVLTPSQALSYDIVMARADPSNPEMSVNFQTEPNTDNPNWDRIWGTVTHDGQDVCAMVLANGQSMFSCPPDNSGVFDLEVPLHPDTGEITLQVYAAGFAPYKVTFLP